MPYIPCSCSLFVAFITSLPLLLCGGPVPVSTLSPQACCLLMSTVFIHYYTDCDCYDIYINMLLADLFSIHSNDFGFPLPWFLKIICRCLQNCILMKSEKKAKKFNERKPNTFHSKVALSPDQLIRNAWQSLWFCNFKFGLLNRAQLSVFLALII